MRLQPRRLFLAVVVGLFAIFFNPIELFAQDTPDYFRQSCIGCHTIGGGKLTGPDLKDVSKRRDRQWLIDFIMDPKVVLDRGDDYSRKLLEDYPTVMPKPPNITLDRAEKLIDLIDAESKLEESQFKGKISTEPFTATDVTLGRDLFIGTVALQNGGTACVSCHSMHDIPILGGGQLGPDLTNIYERQKGRKALSAWLIAPGTPTMEPIFKQHKLKSDEIHALVAYFESTAGESESEPATKRIALLLMGLAGAAALVFAFDAIWKKRFHSVRQTMVNAPSTKD